MDQTFWELALRGSKASLYLLPYLVPFLFITLAVGVVTLIVCAVSLGSVIEHLESLDHRLRRIENEVVKESQWTPTPRP